MNRYALTVIMFMSSISLNILSKADSETKGRMQRAAEWVGSFGKEVVTDNPKKLALAGVIKAHAVLGDTKFHVSLSGMNPRVHLRFQRVARVKLSSFPAMIVAYSAGRTIYNRLKS
jgi:predicted transcriptional regulator